MFLFYAVINDYDYVFSENGLVAHKDGKLTGTEVLSLDGLYALSIPCISKYSWLAFSLCIIIYLLFKVDLYLSDGLCFFIPAELEVISWR